MSGCACSKTTKAKLLQVIHPGLNKLAFDFLIVLQDDTESHFAIDLTNRNQHQSELLQLHY